MKEILLNYINEQVINDAETEQVEADDDLLGSGILDSLGMMRFILFIENEFSIKVPPEDMTIENFMSVDTIAAYLEKNK